MYKTSLVGTYSRVPRDISRSLDTSNVSESESGLGNEVCEGCFNFFSLSLPVSLPICTWLWQMDLISSPDQNLTGLIQDRPESIRIDPATVPDQNLTILII